MRLQNSNACNNMHAITKNRFREAEKISLDYAEYMIYLAKQARKHSEV